MSATATTTIYSSFPHLLTTTTTALYFTNSHSHSTSKSNTFPPQVSSTKINTTCAVPPIPKFPHPPWTVSEIAEAMNGTILKWGPPGSISTDTRTLQPGQWFFAITGLNFDAHHFITPNLYSLGCVGVIANRVSHNWDKGFVQIESSSNNNTLISLNKMAIYARNRFHGPLIGLTGSVGKTTTRTMIALALEGLGSVHQSPGNWNNRIGVSLSLIGIPRNVDFAVLELGMSGKGEILELARMCRPSIRVILNVGASHLGNFGSLEEVSVAKGEILREAKPGDVCVLFADDPLVMSLPVPIGVKRVLFGRRMDCDVRLLLAESTDGGLGVRVVLERNKEIDPIEEEDIWYWLALALLGSCKILFDVLSSRYARGELTRVPKTCASCRVFIFDELLLLQCDSVFNSLVFLYAESNLLGMLCDCQMPRLRRCLWLGR